MYLVHLSLQGVSLENLNAAYAAGYRHFIVQAKGPTDDIVAGVVREWLHSSAIDREELFTSVKVSGFRKLIQNTFARYAISTRIAVPSNICVSP